MEEKTALDDGGLRPQFQLIRAQSIELAGLRLQFRARIHIGNEKFLAMKRSISAAHQPFGINDAPISRTILRLLPSGAWRL
jgi:hypothetical protein